MNFGRTLISATKSFKSYIPYSSYSTTILRQQMSGLLSKGPSYINPEVDPSTLSNYKQFNVEHTTLYFKVDWANQKVHGQVKYHLTSDNADEIVLDTSFLDVQYAELDGSEVEFLLDSKPKNVLGSPLTISKALKNGKHTLKLRFSTTAECSALQWLTPEQTSGKKIPYMFSQCQEIHARSLFPCFDTPSIKSKFQFVVKSEHPTVASGVKVRCLSRNKELGFFGSLSGTESLEHFEQNVPIPSYLVAIASGDLAADRIGPRSQVYSEPKELAACKYEFEHDTEGFIKAAEKIVFPYEWGYFNILVLPPGFPYGGMENPNITFATPSIISGDRQNVDVIAHELAHSWSGNLVTNSSWEHFWLNEGWTVYLERRIQGAIHGEAYRHLSAIIGWATLEEAVKQIPAEFTSLVVDLKGGVDPDDASSVVPYERGFCFLFHLETVLGGFDEFDPFIPYYFKEFRYSSLDSYQFKHTVYKFFSHKKEILDKVDWDGWYFNTGLPPKPKFDTTLTDQCDKLVDSWVKADSADLVKFSQGDISSWTTTQQQVFLDKLDENINATKAPSKDVVEALDAAYDFSKSNNKEVTFRWYKLTLHAKQTKDIQEIANWLGTIGRMKYVRPLFKLLNELDRPLALATFEKYEYFYHPICRAMLKKDLAA